MRQLGIDTNLQNLPIDQYSRQYWVAQMLNSVRKKDKIFKILDVGGYRGQTKDFQYQDEVTICDLFDVDEPDYVKADGTNLPFGDNTFDYCLTFDVLEHIPKQLRENFLNELSRVSKIGVIIAAPFDSSHSYVLSAEKRLNEYYRALYVKPHRWLEEHIDLVTPKNTEIEKYFSNNMLYYAKLPTNDLTVWELVQYVYFSVELDFDLGERSHELNWHYNSNITKLDQSTPENSYRTIYFVSAKKDLTATIQRFIDKLPSKDTNQVNEFTSNLMHVYGLKYRDIIKHVSYLDERIVNAYGNDGKRLVERAKSFVKKSTAK